MDEDFWRRIIFIPYFITDKTHGGNYVESYIFNPTFCLSIFLLAKQKPWPQCPVLMRQYFFLKSLHFNWWAPIICWCPFACCFFIIFPLKRRRYDLIGLFILGLYLFLSSQFGFFFFFLQLPVPTTLRISTAE